MLRSALELIVEGGDAAHPALSVSLGGGLKLGWDNPDNLHHNAVLDGRYEYRLSGTRGDAHYFSLGVYAGSYAKGGGRVVAFVEIDDLAIAPDGTFEVILSRASTRRANWIRLDSRHHVDDAAPDLLGPRERDARGAAPRAHRRERALPRRSTPRS